MHLLRPIDRFLNATTMYRTVFYGLCCMAVVSIALGFAGVLYFTGLQQIGSLLLIVIVCAVSNELCARIWKVPVNSESVFITALILFFLLNPIERSADALAIAVAGVIAMASKYVLALRGKHLFNPAALAAVIVGFAYPGSVLWWIGTPSMLPITLIVGFLIVRKIRRFALFFSTVAASFVTVALLGIINGQSVGDALLQHLLSWPIIFFASVMVTEPLTAPPLKRDHIIYGLFVGALSTWPIRIGPVFFTPELSLVIANLYAYAVSLRRRLFLRLKEKRLIARDTYEFLFDLHPPLSFRPGQYLEWTLPHAHPDSRGNRRYFTIASSPTEPGIGLGVKIGEARSSFKNALAAMKPGGVVLAGQLAGDFTLPKNEAKKLVFIAGGIGITPFRSMIKYVIDTKEKRDIILFYAARSAEDLAYKDGIDEAAAIGLKTVYVLGDDPDPDRRIVSADMLREEVPDLADRMVYLSGPSVMVDACKTMLIGMGKARRDIKTDYFPGFA